LGPVSNWRGNRIRTQGAGDSGFAKYDIKGDSYITKSIIGDSGFAEFDIIVISIIGDSRLS
jgi:hypothetical protein